MKNLSDDIIINRINDVKMDMLDDLDKYPAEKEWLRLNDKRSILRHSLFLIQESLYKQIELIYRDYV